MSKKQELRTINRNYIIIYRCFLVNILMYVYMCFILNIYQDKQITNTLQKTYELLNNEEHFSRHLEGMDQNLIYKETISCNRKICISFTNIRMKNYILLPILIKSKVSQIFVAK